MSSAPVWTKKLARAVPATPSRRMSGWAQWWPARTATPSASSAADRSCGMDAREVEGHDARPDLRIAGPVDLEVLDLAEAGERLPDELRVVPPERLAAQALHVVDRRA